MKKKYKTKYKIIFKEIEMEEGNISGGITQRFIVDKKEYEKVYNSVSKLKKGGGE